jgi:hypothetical protein
MATASAIIDDSDACVLCTSKHNRSRPSFCLCKHCSIPLCLECMNQHHNDILQNVAELSHQYNELQELLQSKQKMIVDESTKTVSEVNGYFDSYVKELRTVQRQIIGDLQTTKEKAQVSEENSMGVCVSVLFVGASERSELGCAVSWWCDSRIGEGEGRSDNQND